MEETHYIRSPIKCIKRREISSTYGGPLVLDCKLATGFRKDGGDMVKLILSLDDCKQRSVGRYLLVGPPTCQSPGRNVQLAFNVPIVPGDRSLQAAWLSGLAERLLICEFAYLIDRWLKCFLRDSTDLG